MYCTYCSLGSGEVEQVAEVRCQSLPSGGRRLSAGEAQAASTVGRGSEEGRKEREPETTKPKKPAETGSEGGQGQAPRAGTEGAEGGSDRPPVTQASHRKAPGTRRQPGRTSPSNPIS